MNGQMRKITAVCVFVLTLALLFAQVPAALAADDDVVSFADANLKLALLAIDGVDINEDDELTEGELAAITGSLDLSGQAIADLTGLQFVTGVTALDLSNNAISDIAVLAALTSLVSLDVSNNYLDTSAGSDDRAIIDALTAEGCSVTYQPQNDIAVTGLALNPSAAELCPNDTVQLAATVLPENATNKTVTWQSNNTSVATVTTGGMVTAKAAGAAVITATTQDGSFSRTCTVTVKSPKLTSSTYFIGTTAVRGVPVLTDINSFKAGFANDAANLFLYNGSSVYTGPFIKTGLTVRLVVGSTVRDSRTIIVEGDVSGDGKISIDDYSRLKLHLLGKKTLSSPYIDAGDYNRDGKYTVADYVRLRLNILGLGDTGGPLPANLPVVTNTRIRRFLDVALAQLGKPYVWGGDKLEHGGFDCSGFVYYSLNQSGYKVGRSSANTYSKKSNWAYVNKNALQPGDLMFYVSDSDPSRIGHIGIYLGNGYHVHASSDYQCIIICGVEGWYERALSHGRRVNF